jgi:hypothetical protein
MPKRLSSLEQKIEKILALLTTKNEDTSNETGEDRQYKEDEFEYMKEEQTNNDNSKKEKNKN